LRKFVTSEWADFADDLWFEPQFKSKVVDVISPSAIRFFSAGIDATQRGKVMNEITVAVAAMRAAADSHKAAADALQALSKKLSLEAFDPPLDEKGTPPPSVGALRIALSEAAAKHGKDAIKAIVQAEADGKPIGEMSDDQRLMVLIALNAADALKATHG
jgi:hypothetical protein